MIVFTLFGIACYWFLMGVVGYVLGYGLCMWVDFNRGIKRLTAVDREMDKAIGEITAIVTWMTAYGAAKEQL